MSFASPRDAMEAGIATVFQDLAMIPLMAVSRNFFMGREPTRGWGPTRRIDIDRMNEGIFIRFALTVQIVHRTGRINQRQ